MRLSESLNGRSPELPREIEVVGTGPDWLRYQCSKPKEYNPEIMKRMVEQDYKIIGLHEVPRRLEQVYLQAVNEGEEDDHVG